jgi:predicted dehydrogenase
MLIDRNLSFVTLIKQSNHTPIMEKIKTSQESGVATRREFIKKTATAAAVIAATPFFKTPVYGQSQAPSANVKGANDRIVVGYIGIGGRPSNSPGMGLAHVESQKKNAADNNIAQAAVCDLYTKRVDIAKKVVGDGCEGFGDYRKLLERKDIDAVVIATHDIWHAPCAIDAMNAGKHVYCEKPMTRYLGEAFDVYDAVKKTGKVFQLGSQGCSAAAWHKAADMIQAGKIGQLVWAQGYYCRNNPKGEWNYSIDPNCTPDNTNWDMWLGKVKHKVAFNPDHFFRWRKYYPYCAGLFGDLVPHRLTPLMLATGNPEFPTRVVSIGSKNVHTDKAGGQPERDVEEHVQLIAQFPSGMSLVVAASTVNAKSPGFVIYGHKATLEIGTSGEKLQLTPEKEFSDELDAETLNGLTPTEEVDVHEKNWFDCIRSGKQPNANIDLAVKSQTVITLAEMSDRLNITCLFDPKTRKVTTGEGKEINPLTYGSLELSLGWN